MRKKTKDYLVAAGEQVLFVCAVIACSLLLTMCHVAIN